MIQEGGGELQVLINRPPSIRKPATAVIGSEKQTAPALVPGPAAEFIARIMPAFSDDLERL